jgi:hypothetical protein
VNDIVVVFEGSYQLWKYEDSGTGENDILGELIKQKHGAFAIPGKGYWTSNFLFKIARRTTRMGLLICAGEQSGYEVD